MGNLQFIFMAFNSIGLEQVACYVEGYEKESVNEARTENQKRGK